MAIPAITAIGLMSGTSMDGVDAALLTSDGAERLSCGPALTVPYDDALKARLRAALGPDGRIDTALERDLAEIHAVAVDKLLDHAAAGYPAPSLIGFHGHTVFHDPSRGLTHQIGDAGHLADRIGLPVIHDFRSADVAAGGQGAPLVPVYHRALAASAEKPVAVVNVGGVANVTWVGADGALLAFDTGPGNAPLDDWIWRHCGIAFDRGGALALSGTVNRALLDRLLADPFFDLLPPKSLDRSAFRDGAVEGLSPADGAATLAAFTAASIARSTDHMPQPPKRWLICGGGRHNPAIMRSLGAQLAAPVAPIDALGMDGDAIEAQAFAYLAIRVERGLPTTFPQTTGAPRPICGGRRCDPALADHADNDERRASLR